MVWPKFGFLNRLYDGERTTPYWKTLFLVKLGNSLSDFRKILYKDGRMWKFSKHENPIWRMTTILNIVISPYFSELWTNFDEIFNVKLAWNNNENLTTKIKTSAAELPDLCNILYDEWRKTRQWSRSNATNFKLWKFKMAVDSHLENRYIAIFQCNIMNCSML